MSEAIFDPEIMEKGVYEIENKSETETQDESESFDKMHDKIVDIIRPVLINDVITESHASLIGIRIILALEKIKENYSHFFEGKRMLDISEEAFEPPEVMLLRKISSNKLI